jgi:hypothetical protein
LNQRIYIGGEFSSADLSQIIQPEQLPFLDVFFPQEIRELKRSFFESGADSLAFILSTLNTDSLLLWTPDNFCYESLQRVQQKLASTRITISRYAETDRIVYQPGILNVVVITHFNRYDPALTSAVKRGAEKIVLIEDFTQAPLDIGQTKADHSFCSLRKFIPVSASVTYAPVYTPLQPTDSESAYLKIKKLAGELKTDIIQNPLYGEENLYLNLFTLAEKQLVRSTIRPAHSGQIEILHHIHFEKILQQRRDNYNFLQREIRPGKTITGFLPGSYMYFIVIANDQQTLRKLFFQHGIFPAIHWQDSLSEISTKILSFHIDHRYRPSVLKRVVDVLGALEKEST